jgi:H+/Cl- antiporter ClcA
MESVELVDLKFIPDFTLLLVSFFNYLWTLSVLNPIGAAAYTGAITHSLSIAVIVCETTGQLCALLPVLVSLFIKCF